MPRVEPAPTVDKTFVAVTKPPKRAPKGVPPNVWKVTCALASLMQATILRNGSCTAVELKDKGRRLCVAEYVPGSENPRISGGGCQGHQSYFGDRERHISAALQVISPDDVRKGTTPRGDRTSAPAWIAGGVVVFEMSDAALTA